MTVQTVHVPLGARSYDILVGTGLIDRAGTLLAPRLRRKKAAVVTDENIAAAHLPRLMAALTAEGIAAEAIILPPGEKTKSWAMLERVTEGLLAAKIERGDLVIAFGGGVIGDLAGFAAAILRRGVAFCQIPTSLLAQVDSSVGGKTGINSPLGKNLIGAFHQPSLVLADIDVLDTLSDREFLSGYAEVVKYGLLGDRDFFEWLEANGPALAAGDKAKRSEAVRRSCAAKAGVVSRDETEQGERALLNLGHTFGHALEAATGYGPRLLHGEGVSIGMALAFEASARLGLCARQESGRATAHLRRMGMKTTLADIPGDLPDADGLIALMGQDKKVVDGRVTFILARGVGAAFICKDADMDVIRAVLTEALAAR